MADRGLTPLEPYVDNRTPWKSTCGNCGEVTSPTLASVKKALKQQQPKCCDWCRRNGPIRPEVAEDLLRRAGAEAIAPFPGIKEEWLARCLNEHCRKLITPSLDSIKHAGTGACWHCGGYGIRADDEALVYLMAHSQYDAAKIGICKVGSKRIAHHESVGWTLVSSIHMPGYEARDVEQRVLDEWKRLNLPYGVQASRMPYAGYTETVSLGARSLDEVQADIAQASAYVYDGIRNDSPGRDGQP